MLVRATELLKHMYRVTNAKSSWHRCSSAADDSETVTERRQTAYWITLNITDDVLGTRLECCGAIELLRYVPRALPLCHAAADIMWTATARVRRRTRRIGGDLHI